MKIDERIDEFLTAVAQMRNAQKAYFKHRDSTSLNLSKEYERRVDVMIDEHERDREPDLFSQRAK